MVNSVSVYRSKKGYTLLIPYGSDKQGIGRALDVFGKLDQPFDAKTLGKVVREYLQVSKDSPVVEDMTAVGVFERATGIKGWAKFSREHLLVGVVWNPEKGYKISPMKRAKGGGYLSEKGDPVIEIGLDSLDEEIGEAVLKAFSHLE